MDEMQRKVPESVGGCFEHVENDLLNGPWVMEHRNADAGALQLHRQRLGQRNNGMLGHRVGTNPRNRSDSN